MKIKHLAIAVVLAVIAVMSCVSISAQPSIAKATSVEKTSAAEAPALKPEDLLKIRDVQYQHASRSASMLDLDRQFKELKALQDADVQKLAQIIKDAAKVANVDLTKWVFDIEALKFVPRDKPPAPAADATPPKGGTPNKPAGN